MPDESTIIATAAEDNDGSATTIDDLQPDVLTQALRLLDGRSLAAVSCATSHLRSLSTQSDLWFQLCLSTWPSLSDPRLLPLLLASPHSFFADAFPFTAGDVSFANDETDADLPCKLISAVDIYNRGVPVLSRVIETDTSSPWFFGSPFRIDALERKDPQPPPPGEMSPENLTMSWIVIDTSRGRAVNLSSRRAVAVERHWFTGETMVRFAATAEEELRGWVMAAVVTCGEGTGHMREVVLMVEDMDGACVSGGEGLRVVKAAMEAGRKGRGKGEEEEEVKRRYLEYLRKKRRRKESRARTEGMVDLCCSAVGGAVFLAFLLLVVFR